MPRIITDSITAIRIRIALVVDEAHITHLNISGRWSYSTCCPVELSFHLVAVEKLAEIDGIRT